MADMLKGKKVAILAADMFERVELEEPRKALEDEGAKVEVVSLEGAEIKGFDHFEPANTVRVDRTVDEVSPDDYDGLILQDTHHRSHAASAFYPSPFERAAILTIDGVGEWATASLGRGTLAIGPSR